MIKHLSDKHDDDSKQFPEEVPQMKITKSTIPHPAWNSLSASAAAIVEKPVDT